MSLSVNILTDSEFEKLPYPEASMSLGIADTKKGQAYVRYVANEELQKYLINHELEHLLGEDRDEIHHGGDGVYYKGFGNVFSGIGQAIGGAGQSIGGAASSIGKGLSGVGSQLAGSLGNAMNFGGGFKGGANPSGGMAAAAASSPGLRAPMGSGFGGLSAMGQTLGQMMPRMMSTQGMGKSPLQGFVGGGVGKMSGGSAMSPASQFGDLVKQVLGGGQASSTTSTTPSSPTQSTSGQGFNPWQLGAGVGLNAMSLFGPKPRVPDASSLGSVQALQNFNVNKGMGGEMDPALIEALNRDYDRMDQEELRDFTSRWKNIRPGADLESDSVYARDFNELKRQQAVRRGDQMAKYRFEMIKNNLALSDLEMKRLSEIAQYDIDSITLNTGLDYFEAQKLKDMFSGIGDRLVSSGLGFYNTPETQGVTNAT